MGFLIRWAAAFFLLAATYNPTDLNFVRWSMTYAGEQLPLTILFGLLLFIGYIIYLRATFRSIGVFGVVLLLAVVASMAWVLWDQDFVSFENPTFNTWAAIVVLAAVMAIGLGWSIIRRRLSGQTDVDDIDA